MVLAAVREELKQGADFIKIMLGGGVSSETDGIETVQYSPEEVRAVTSSAWQMGKKMVRQPPPPFHIGQVDSPELRWTIIGDGSRVHSGRD